MPNPWDVGTARILAGLGYRRSRRRAPGWPTGSAAATARRGLARGGARALGLITAATELPVNGDLENGFGHDPESVAETIRGAAAAGLVGCSIEDSTSAPGEPIYPLAQAVERIAAAAEAAAALPFPFTLTARAENYLHGRRDLDDTIARLQAFEEAGADVLYAPRRARHRGHPHASARRVSRPVNVLALPGRPSVEVLSEAGVRRMSLGSGFINTASARSCARRATCTSTATFGCLAGNASGGEIAALHGRRLSSGQLR